MSGITGFDVEISEGDGEWGPVRTAILTPENGEKARLGMIVCQGSIWVLGGRELGMQDVEHL